MAARRRGARRPILGTRDRIPVVCLVAYLTVWSLLAIAPRDRTTWALENVPIAIGVPLTVLTFRRFRFSDRAYVQATVFLVLHAIGSHYTYSEVPLGARAAAALGWSRNHYDRLVHFCFGLLLLQPLRELGFHGRRQPGRWAVLGFSVAGIACWSALYEVAEWLVAAVVDPGAGTAYVGTQGDPWDAQKDMALAVVGALLAALPEAFSSAASSVPRGTGAERGRAASGR